MTNVTINTHASCAMAVDAPAHRVIYFSTHAMHLSNLAVTCRAFESRSNVRLVRVENICLRLVPIHSAPWRLLFMFTKCCKLLHLGTLGHYRFVTPHARRDVWNSRVRRLVYVFMTERAFKLRPFFFGHVLPVIKLDGLLRR